jgi:hypothetical protein
LKKKQKFKIEVYFIYDENGKWKTYTPKFKETDKRID